MALAGSAACTTTTRLGPAADPETVHVVEELATQPNAYARVAEPPPVVQPIYGVNAPSPIVGHEPGWLTLSKTTGPMRVPLTQVRSVSTYDHPRGALDGAVAGGVIGFVLGFAAGAAIGSVGSCNADGPCDPSISVGTRLRMGGLVGGVVGSLMATLCAAVGAFQGHEMRYEIAAP